ncbi:MAG TPA: siroheme synthase CysG [Methylocella sp.]|nr:siroheme synthase CysG [Methylocella sp.]
MAEPIAIKGQEEGEYSLRSAGEDTVCLPVFFALKGKRVVFAGGSPALSWKAEFILATGAHLDVFSRGPCLKLQALAERHETLRLIPRDIEPTDFSAATLAIAEARSGEEALLQATARAHGVPINIVDKPEFSDFQFGAIVERAPLIIGISTSGRAPKLAQVLRGFLEAFLSPHIKFWLREARQWRERREGLGGVGTRHRFWDLFSERALFAKRPPLPDEFSTLFKKARAQSSPDSGRATLGSVALVGAGPGDPDLLTLKALRSLQSADVILHDDLVTPAILEIARREAEKIPVGKRGYKPSCRQDHIVSQMVALALAGNRVVRLKGGDPMIFGRANEEIAALREAGIPVEIVPGVTAALAAAAAVQTSLTERDKARRLQFITAHAQDGKLPEDIDWHTVADPKTSTVVYMGVRMLKPLTEILLAEGLPPSTPALLVERVTWPDEHCLRGTIGTLADEVAGEALPGPCIIMIGDVFAHAISLPSTEATFEPMANAGWQPAGSR